MLWRVWGDYYAATGDGKAARRAYLDADRLSPGPQSFVQQTARLGAHARSTEEFLKEKHFDRAAVEIHAWQQELPSARLDGYLTLLYARYWAGRSQHVQAIAQAEQLQAVNPDSPYVDQLLLLAADSAMRLGHKDRALATLHSLVKDYPGSPLVPLAKKNIEILESRSGD
jgi:TolA-binding protein